MSTETVPEPVRVPTPEPDTTQHTGSNDNNDGNDAAPPQPHFPPLSPNPLKRKPSSPSSDRGDADESNKRARVSPEPAPDSSLQQENGRADHNHNHDQDGGQEQDHDSGEGGGGGGGGDNDSDKRSTPDHPPRRPDDRPAARRRALEPVDERKRGRRLFGAVLGALGQGPGAASRRPGAGRNSGSQINNNNNSSSSSANAGTNARRSPSASVTAKRREIEARQREKLATQASEDEEARAARLAVLAGAREREQRRFDARARELRHAGMRAAARSLRTDVAPRLHFRPWSMTAEQERMIDRQMDEVEARIEKEMYGVREREKRYEEDRRREKDRERAEKETAMDTGHGRHESRDAKEEEKKGGSDAPADPSRAKGLESASEQPPSTSVPGQDSRSREANERLEDADDGGDDHVDMDGDDAVLY